MRIMQSTLDYTWNTRNRKGLNHCQCIDCPYDTLGAGAGVKMRAHCQAKGHGIPTEYKGEIQEYISRVNGEGTKSVIITLGYLCWNTRDISVEGVQALVAEAERLIQLGNFPMICVVDNGSTDSTMEAIRSSFKGKLPHYLHLCDLPRNMGNCTARNVIIDFAKIQGSKYTLFMDGDIEIVPLSSYTMMRYLECHSDLGVIGAYSANFSDKRHECATNLIEIPESRTHDDIRCAWTQYGLFRTDLFHKGVRFDEGGPFGGPGWGYEDDDLHYQIRAAGYKNRYFGGMRYLHRALHSSWPELEAQGINLDRMFVTRKSYLVQKWRKLGLDPVILKLLEGQQLPKAEWYVKPKLNHNAD